MLYIIDRICMRLTYLTEEIFTHSMWQLEALMVLEGSKITLRTF